MQQIIASMLARLRAAAAQLHVTLAPGQAQQLLNYLALLERWYAVHNLSALQGKEELLVRLVFDSLTVTAGLIRQSEGRDMLVSAQTGSGKTVAFGLAMAVPLLGSAEQFQRASVGHLRATQFDSRRFPGEFRMRFRHFAVEQK